LSGQRARHQEAAGSTGQKREKSAQLTAALDHGEFGDVALDQGREVGVEEGGTTARRSTYGFGVPAANRAIEIVALAQRRGVAQRGAMRERGVDEPVGCAVDLALGKRP